MATVVAVHSHQPVVRTPSEVLDSPLHPDQRIERKPRIRPKDRGVSASADKDTFIAEIKAEMTRRDPRHRGTW